MKSRGSVVRELHRKLVGEDTWGGTTRADGCLVEVRFGNGVIARASIPADVFSSRQTSVELLGEASWGAPVDLDVPLMLLDAPYHAAE